MARLCLAMAFLVYLSIFDRQSDGKVVPGTVPQGYVGKSDIDPDTHSLKYCWEQAML
jgi:hypothetical protein